MWKIYDQLINQIPGELKVSEVIPGPSWTMVRTKENAGVAMTLNQTFIPSIKNFEFAGTSLKELAALVKSWNFAEASIGLAAINAYYNSKEQINKNIAGLSPQTNWHISYENEDVFDSYTGAIKGKKVAVIGHFPHLEQRIALNNQLSILERNPQYGDYPDTACEYLLPEQDYVFITGCAFVNKSMPRLLQLCKNVRVVLVGPSVPITSLLFDYGVFELGGFVVTDPSLCRKVVSDVHSNPIFVSGERVRLYKKTKKE